MSEIKSTESDTIWAEIKDLPIEMFGLPNQRVHNYVSVVPGHPTAVLVKLKASAALPALESTLASQTKIVMVGGKKEARPKFDLKEAENYYVISRHVSDDEEEAVKAEFYIAGASPKK